MVATEGDHASVHLRMKALEWTRLAMSRSAMMTTLRLTPPRYTLMLYYA